MQRMDFETKLLSELRGRVPSPMKCCICAQGTRASVAGGGPAHHMTVNTSVQKFGRAATCNTAGRRAQHDDCTLPVSLGQRHGICVSGVVSDCARNGGEGQCTCRDVASAADVLEDCTAEEEGGGAPRLREDLGRVGGCTGRKDTVAPAPAAVAAVPAPAPFKLHVKGVALRTVRSRG